MMICHNQIWKQELQKGGEKTIHKANADFEYSTTSKRKKTNKGNKEKEDTQLIVIPEAPLPTDITSEGIYFMDFSYIM